MSYLVSPPEPTEWRIDPDDFARRLRARWPDAEVKKIANPARSYLLDFNVTVDGERVDGSLDGEGQALSLEGDARRSAAVATWFRNQVPTSQSLIFYDQGYSADVRIEEGTDPDTLAAPFLAE